MNGNGAAGDGEYVEIDTSEQEMAIALVDRTLSAIGGLETDDADEAAETVARMYLRFLRAIREEE